MEIVAMVTVFLIKMLMVEIMLTVSPGQMCRTGSSPRSSYVTLTFAGFLFFCSHTRSEAQTRTNIKACSDFTKSENFLQTVSSHDYQTSIWNQLFQSPDRQLCMDRQSKDSLSGQFFCNSFAVLDQGRFLWGGIFIATSAQYSGQPPWLPHIRGHR